MRLFNSVFSNSLFTLALMGLLFLNACQNKNSEARQKSKEEMSDEKKQYTCRRCRTTKAVLNHFIFRSIHTSSHTHAT